MKKIYVPILLSIIAFIMYGCGKGNSESESISVDDNNIIVTEQQTLQGVDNNVLESDGIIEPMDSDELETKLSALYKDQTLDEIIKLFGKEPFYVKETNENVFEYYSGEITIRLWGLPLFQACVEDKNGIRMIPLYNNPFAELVESDIPEPTEHVNTKSDYSVSGLPTFTNSSNAKKWEIIQTTQEMIDYNGNTIEKGIYAISRTDPVGKPMPAGNPQPSLRIGDEHNGNYSVSFDYCIPDKGPLFFMMYDDSDTVYANEQLGEEYYWYELFANGRFNMCTTFGKNSKHICSSDGNFITVENYDPTIWNHCTLNVIDSGIEVFINDELITVLDSLNNKKTGRLGLDGIQGTMFRNIDFRD